MLTCQCQDQFVPAARPSVNRICHKSRVFLEAICLMVIFLPFAKSECLESYQVSSENTVKVFQVVLYVLLMHRAFGSSYHSKRQRSIPVVSG